MNIEVKFKIGEIVFLITDSDQKNRIVTGYIVRDSLIFYYLTSGTEETTHFDYEIATNKNFAL